jgi:hypothetical protein
MLGSLTPPNQLNTPRPKRLFSLAHSPQY